MRSPWFSRRAIGLHVTAIVLIPTFLILGRWQLLRALSGNTLSWAYTFEWPIFAAYGIYMWWNLVHDQPAFEHAKTQVQHEDDQDPDLDAYNAYLAQLHGESAPERRKTAASDSTD